MQINEFIDTYSDDLLILHDARAALLTHPLKGYYGFRDLLDASFCRIIAVFTIGGIEAMLESWRERDRINILDKSFQEKTLSNKERVDSLYQAFVDGGIQVDRQVFDDYLAIKHLRNTIVHGKWNEGGKEWLEARGFPTDTRNLRKEHLDRIEHVIQN